MSRRWEYRVEDCQQYHPARLGDGEGFYQGLDVERLNELGLEGWELIRADDHGQACLFKRETSWQLSAEVDAEVNADSPAEPR